MAVDAVSHLARGNAARTHSSRYCKSPRRDYWSKREGCKVRTLARPDCSYATDRSPQAADSYRRERCYSDADDVGSRASNLTRACSRRAVARLAAPRHSAARARSHRAPRLSHSVHRADRVRRVLVQSNDVGGITSHARGARARVRRSRDRRRIACLRLRVEPSPRRALTARAISYITGRHRHGQAITAFGTAPRRTRFESQSPECDAADRSRNLRGGYRPRVAASIADASCGSNGRSVEHRNFAVSSDN